MENQKITILICDDSAFIRMMAKSALVRNNFEVVGEVGDGPAAVEAYRQFRPDIVLLDLVMPGSDGLEAAKEILKENPQALILMMSELSSTSIISEALHSGVKDFLPKPFTTPKLIAGLQKVLAMGGK